MRKLLLSIGLLLVGFSAMSSWAISINDGGTYNGQNVGQLDYLIDQQFHNGPGGNPAGETSWVNNVLAAQPAAPSVTFATKYDPVTYYTTDTANHFAFQLAENVDYFMIKNSTYRALFENKNNFGWGVFDTTLLDNGFNLPDANSYQISHVTQFVSDEPRTTNIPEPQTMTVLFLGILCLLVARRKNVLSKVLTLGTH